MATQTDGNDLTFGQWLKRRRRGLGLTQRSLGQQAGYSGETIRKVEADDLRPSHQLAERLAAALHIEPDERVRFIQFARAEPDGDAQALATQTVQLKAAAKGRRHNLPASLTTFFGRDIEIAELTALLTTRRLVTLTGVGGVGKTRLALQVAERSLSHFDHGVWVVELAALSEPALVAQQVCAALDLGDASDQPPLGALTRFLGGRRLLLVLDNCEHLLDACASLTDALLRACPGLKILATSRASLGVAGEALFLVQGLPWPDTDQGHALERLGEFASVQLFVDRARLVRPDYELATHNAAAAARICQRLEGIALAIEMAAARLSILTAEQLADRLEDAFGLLTGGSRTAVPQHQTLRTTLDWSYGLLNAPEQRLVQRLSVFAGGCTLEAAEAVCAGKGLEANEVIDCLALLAAKSMVIVDRRPSQAPRYRLLEIVRQYAAEKLDAAGESRLYRALHRDYFGSLVARPHAVVNGNFWAPKLSGELENFRLALEWSFRDDADVNAGPALLLQVLDLPLLSEQEVWTWSERATTWARMHPSLAPRNQVHVARLAANKLAATDLPGAVAALKQVVKDSRALGAGSKLTLVWSLADLGRWLASLNELEAAWAAYAEAEAEFFTTDLGCLVPGELAWSKAQFAAAKARLANKQGRYAEAKAFSVALLHHLQENGEPDGNYGVWLELGHTSLELNEYDEAHEHFTRARVFAAETLPESGEAGFAYVNRCLGFAALGRADVAQAHKYCQISLKEVMRGPFAEFIPSSVGLAACVAARRGEALRAAKLSGASHALYARMGRPTWEDSSLETLLPGWGEGPEQAAIRQAYAAGQAMTSDQAVDFALSDAAA